MDKYLISIWAGIIWRMLNERDKHSIQGLTQATGLEFEAIYSAVGWLAREGNISFDDNKKLSLHIYHKRYYCFAQNIHFSSGEGAYCFNLIKNENRFEGESPYFFTNSYTSVKS